MLLVCCLVLTSCTKYRSGDAAAPPSSTSRKHGEPVSFRDGSAIKSRQPCPPIDKQDELVFIVSETDGAAVLSDGRILKALWQPESGYRFYDQSGDFLGSGYIQHLETMALVSSPYDPIHLYDFGQGQLRQGAKIIVPTRVAGISNGQLVAIEPDPLRVSCINNTGKVTKQFTSKNQALELADGAVRVDQRILLHDSEKLFVWDLVEDQVIQIGIAAVFDQFYLDQMGYTHVSSCSAARWNVPRGAFREETTRYSWDQSSCQVTLVDPKTERLSLAD